MKLIQEIETEENLLTETVQKTLELSKNKINDVEVCIRKTIGINVHVRNKVVENVEFKKDGALFLTVYNKFSKGSVSSKDFSLNNIKNMLDTAVKISKYSSSDFFSGLPNIDLLCFHSIDLDLFHPWEFNVKNAIRLAEISEQEAFKYDNKIINSEGSIFNSYITINSFGNSLGMIKTYKSTRHFIYNCVIAQDKKFMERDYYYSVSRDINELEKPEVIGKKSAKRALSRIGSKKICTIKSPIIFSREISSDFFYHLVDAIKGDNVCQKSTFLIHDLKKRIFPIWLNIEENPHIKKELGSQPFDNEGVSTTIKYIIKNGILQTWLLNCYNARKLGLLSTGNSGGIYNWIVTNQGLPFEKLLKQMNKGLLVTELLGQGVDIVSGNYSRGAVGFWIDNGEIKYPVNEVTISSNLRDMWNNIVNISNDLDTRNNIKSGSILVSEMQISGN